MARLVVLIGTLLLATLPAGASNAVSLGYSDETTIVGPGTDACASGVLIHNHDGSFEYAYMWSYGGIVLPYYGAFGEGYDLGAGTVVCAALWLTRLEGFIPEPRADCYVWNGGVGTDPGEVLGAVMGAPMSVPVWPQVGENDIGMNIAVTGPFTIGYWGPWPGLPGLYYCAVDQDGPRGDPWTCIAAGIGFPSGWQDPSIVWGPTSSMGCGVYFEQGTPVEGQTWGAIKGLFR